MNIASLLFTNCYLVTVDADRRVIERGWIAIEDDLITGIGAMDELGERRARETIDMGGKMVLPGFVNGHNHHWGSLFKNTGEGLLLEDWLDEVTLPLMAQLSNEDLEVAGYLGALEQIRTGTTCSLNHVVNINDPESIKSMVDPVVEVGIRQLVTKELRQTPDPPFSTSYEAHPHVRNTDEELAMAEEVIDRFNGQGGLIHMGLAIETGANWMLHNATSDEMILAGVELARDRNLKISNHCSAGTPWLSIKEFEQQTGGGDVDYLAKIGALAENWVFIHVLHLKGRELDHIARCGASVVTNPVSNAYSCDGIPPMRQLMEGDFNVGLGTDGTYVNCSPDMVEQMKFAALIGNVTHYDPTLMSAETVIEMATIGSATAMGLDHLIGSLEVGKKADLVAFDLNKAHSTVGNRPVATLVFSAHGTDVDTVVVNGELVLRGGDLVTFPDEQEVLDEANARAHAAIKRAGLDERVFVPWRK
ncbi:MAG: amidohydrolase family protein [Thermoleophilia bacterium]|nr:amidohydrolase family protein [Thermoleophilia bacterium]